MSPALLHQVSGSSLYFPISEMLPCLRRVLRPAFSLRAGTGLTGAALKTHQTPALASPVQLASETPLSVVVQRCHLGTHPLKEPMEPLNSPRGAKEFIYSLHPSERTCLLRELHRFESIAIAQGMWFITCAFIYVSSVTPAHPLSCALAWIFMWNSSC